MSPGTPPWSLRLVVICLVSATVRSWDFETRPQNATVQIGHDALIACEAPSGINPIYLYQKDRGTLTNRAGAETSGLRITNIHRSDEGWYTCTVNSDKGPKSASAYLRVIDAITFSKRPHNVTVSRGHSATLTCEVTTSNPVTYTWLKEGRPVSPSNKVTVERGTLNISSVQLDDVDVYTCKASTASGSISADAAILLPDLLAPVFDEIPKDIIIIQTTSSQVTVHCAASGIPTPAIEWKYNGQTIPRTTSTFLVKANGDLHINQASVTASGRYTCIASNIKGTKSHTITITVTPPSTRSSPTNSNEILGDTTLFIATAVAGSLLVLLIVVGTIVYCKCGKHKSYRSRRSSYNSRRSSRRCHSRRHNDGVAMASWDTSVSPPYMMAFPDDDYSGATMPISEYDYNSRPVSFNFATNFSHSASRRSFSPSDHSYPGFAHPVRNPTFGLDDIQSTLHRQMRELEAMATSAQSTPRSNASSHGSGTPQKKRQPARATSTPKPDSQKVEARRYSTVSQMMSGEPFEEPEEWGPEHEEVVSIQANIRMSRLWEVDSATKMANLDAEDFEEEDD